MLVYIDHYDSFSDTLIDYFKQLGEEVTSLRTDELSIEKIDTIKPDFIVIGPGPGHPLEPSLDKVKYLLECYHTKLPILGICLGHQLICQFFGARIERLDIVHHGIVSALLNKQGKIFNGLDKCDVTRYHSLAVSAESFPQCLNITATCLDNNIEVVMACEHDTYPIYGLQFHPEAIKTSYGLKMLENFLRAKKKQP